MKQLSGLDSGFLSVETGTSFAHVSSLNLYSPPEGGAVVFHESLCRLLRARIADLPPLRRRLVEVPLGLDLPYWIDDPDFDLDFHVRQIALPAPGDARQLAELVARIIGRPLDRGRPLWELYVIEGLESGLLGVLFKFHHAAVDGASATELFSTLFDSTPHDPGELPEKPWRGEAPPHPLELLSRTWASLLFQPARIARMQWELWNELTRRFVGRGSLPLSMDSLELPSTPAPPTPWNRAITSHRCCAFDTFSLEQVKRVKNAFRTTVNDVILTLCGGGLRAYLERHAALPETPLRAMVPISIREGDEEDTYTNRVTAAVAELGTDEPDPVVRLERVRKSMQGAKELHKAIPAQILQDFSKFAPPAVAAQAARVAAGIRIADQLRPPFNVIISNVPGVRHALYSGESRLEAMYPISAVGDGVGLNITVTSYRERLDVGLVACRELVPDLWDLLDDLRASLKELGEAASAVERVLR